jgi:uncharacterized protein
MTTWLRYIAGLTGIAAAAYAQAAWSMAGRLIAPVNSKVAWPAGSPFSPEDVSFKATDGISLKGWFLADPKPSAAVVLLHGVGATRAQMLPRALWLHSLGYSVLLYDARGCGESAPVNRSFGYFETRDLLGGIGWMQSRGIMRIGCIGFSQGAATVLLASASLPLGVRAVVAEAPYATLRESVENHFHGSDQPALTWLLPLAIPMAEWQLGFKMDDVSPLKEIRSLKTPAFLIAGSEDRIAPAAGIQKLYQAASVEKSFWLVKGTGHGDFFSDASAEYQKRLGDFLRKELSE